MPDSARISPAWRQFLEIRPDGWLRVRRGLFLVRRVNLRDLRVAKRTPLGSVVLKDRSHRSVRVPLIWLVGGRVRRQNGRQVWGNPEAARRIADAVVGVAPHGDALYGTLANYADLRLGRRAAGGGPVDPV